MLKKCKLKNESEIPGSHMYGIEYNEEELMNKKTEHLNTIKFIKFVKELPSAILLVVSVLFVVYLNRSPNLYAYNKRINNLIKPSDLEVRLFLKSSLSDKNFP